MSYGALGRKASIEQRIDKLIGDFPRYLTLYDEHTPFNRPQQLATHARTIHLRRELGGALRAATNSEFCESLYWTLREWGIGKRASHLISYEAFTQVIASRASDIAKLDSIKIDDSALDVRQIADQVWELIDSLDIVENISKLVPCTKALHHLLPDLIVPIDRQYTQTFFGLHNAEFQGQGQPTGQKPIFNKMFSEFSRIARAVGVNSFVGTGGPWRTSRSKVIDNAVVGFCVAERLSKPSENAGSHPVEYWVYENWTVKRARLHRAECGHCNRGRGKQPEVTGHNSQWLGPFDDRSTALGVLERTGQKDRCLCAFCVP